MDDKLLQAAGGGGVDTFCHDLASGSDENAADCDGALVRCESANGDLLVNAATKDGTTPLHGASADGHEAAVDMLLTAGAYPGVSDREGGNGCNGFGLGSTVAPNPPTTAAGGKDVFRDPGSTDISNALHQCGAQAAATAIDSSEIALLTNANPDSCTVGGSAMMADRTTVACSTTTVRGDEGLVRMSRVLNAALDSLGLQGGVDSRLATAELDDYEVDAAVFLAKGGFGIVSSIPLRYDGLATS